MSEPDEFSSPEAVQEWIRQRMARLLDWKRRLFAVTTLDELLNLLSEFGFQDGDLAKALPGTNKRTVRRWRTQGVPASKAAEEWSQIDDLRAIIGYMLADGTYDELGIIAWLRSRSPDMEMKRPLEELGAGNFEEVLYGIELALSSSTGVGSDALRGLNLVSFSDAVEEKDEDE